MVLQTYLWGHGIALNSIRTVNWDGRRHLNIPVTIWSYPMPEKNLYLPRQLICLIISDCLYCIALVEFSYNFTHRFF